MFIVLMVIDCVVHDKEVLLVTLEQPDLMTTSSLGRKEHRHDNAKIMLYEAMLTNVAQERALSIFPPRGIIVV